MKPSESSYNLLQDLLYSAGLRQYRWNDQAYLLRLPQDRSRPGERQC